MSDRSPSTKRALVFGDVFDDIVVIPQGPVRPDTDTTSQISSRPGGSAANVASWLGALGAAVDFVGMVGVADVDRHSALLASVGVTPDLIGSPSLPTGTIVVIIDGESRTMLTEKGANSTMTPDAVPDALLEGASLLHFTGYSLFGRSDDAPVRRLLDRANARHVQVSVDPGSAGYLADYGVDRFFAAVVGANLILPNLEEGRLLTGKVAPIEVAEALLPHFPAAAVTMGADGVVLARRGFGTELVPSTPVDMIDPTGAGDAFAAGFLADWLISGDMLAAARAGVRAGARAVTTVGARPL